MDIGKLSEALTTLKDLFRTHNSGLQWGNDGKPRPKPPAGPRIELQSGASEAEIVATAEETRLFALGLSGAHRFKRRDSFACSATQIGEGEEHRLGASMVIDGRQLYLVQTLAANKSWLVGSRTLLAAGQQGRLIKVAYKVEDGVNYQLCHTIRKPYVIVRHGAGWLELDRSIESNPKGYLCLIFE